jgi:Contractile injection system tape measure protein
VLTSVIEYWNIVGNTSVDGIRESFLQRKGKLMYKESGWILQVEQQPYDMLLQHLPWNISMIQLPWMKQMLQTEWIF